MGSNPFLSRPMEDEPRDPEDDALRDLDNVLGAPVVTKGPQQPLAQHRESSTSSSLLISPATEPATVHVVGVHGGAGATTLATLLGSAARDVGRTWPAPNPWIGAEGGGVLLCGRTHAHGLQLLRDALTAWHSGAYTTGLPLLGLCIVDDGPRLSKAQQSAARTVTKMAPFGWHLSWQETYRYSSTELETPARIKWMLRSIHRQAEALGSKKGRNS